jgi:hypothetical protein
MKKSAEKYLALEFISKNVKINCIFKAFYIYGQKKGVEYS